ncbi:hypothetical protein pb186bvf_010544 [Paramecium bursaria]
MIQLVWELYDGRNHRNQCAELIASGLLLNQTQKTELKITKEIILPEILAQLDGNTFKWVFIFFDRDLYYSGVKEIVGILCGSDLIDFQKSMKQESEGVAGGFLLNGQSSSQPFWNNLQKVNQKEFLYVGMIAVKTKYKGNEFLQFQMLLESLQYLKYLDFKYLVLNTVNSNAKNYLNKLQIKTDTQSNQRQGISDKNILEIKESQYLFMGQIPSLINECQQVIAQNSPKL